MLDHSTSHVELRARALCKSGRFADATHEALSAYGPQLLGLLAGILRNEPIAREVWSSASEDIWRGLPAFEWRSTLRAWCYAVTRRAMARHRRSRAREDARFVARGGWSSIPEPSRVTTAVYLKTDTKARLHALRAELTDDLQLLLVLRVDRNLSWREVVHALHDDPDVSLDARELNRRAAVARKRFERLVARLRRKMLPT